MSADSIWLITGTDTDAGKTVVTAGLLRALRSCGINCQAVKAVQTGCGKNIDGSLNAPDPVVYADACPGAPLYAPATFATACSPYLAAKLEHRTFDFDALVATIRNLSRQAAVTLVEGAGGFLVPLDREHSIADLAVALSAKIILVVANKLGAVNHSLLSIEAIRARGLDLEAVVVVDALPRDATMDGVEANIRRSNVETILERSAPRISAEIPYFPQLASANSEERRCAWPEIAVRLSPVAKAVTERSESATSSALEDTLDFDRQHLWHPYASTHPPVKVWPAASTSGVRIRLGDGRELVDGMSSWWAAIHGYNHPELVGALRAQAARMPHVMFGGLTHEPAVALGRKLLDIMPPGLERFFFADSGSVAVEVALKMAVQYQLAAGNTGKNIILTPMGGYHGDTLGAMSVCDPVTGMHSLFTGILPKQLFIERPHCRFDGDFDPDHIRPAENAFAEYGERIAGVIIEPIVQGAGGMWFYHPEYLRRLRRLCDSHGALLIHDEIATGFGRTGKLFACEWAGIAPDIMCLGKAVTGGMLTLSVVAARQEIAETISRNGVFMHGPTFMANPLACAVAAASLDLLLKTPWRENVSRLETHLTAGLKPCQHMPGVADVRILGGIGVVEMDRPVNVSRLQEFFVGQGAWIRPFARLIYLMPPYVANPDDIAVLTGAIRRAVAEGRWQ